MLLSCGLMTILLFSGWFLFRYVNMDKPLTSWFAEHPSIQLVRLEEGKQGTEVVVRFLDGHHFGDDYHALARFLGNLGPHYHLSIAEDQSVFHPIWKKHGASIMEAYQQGRYTKIEEWIAGLKEAGQAEEGYVLFTSKGMFIYLDLIDEEDFFIRLPAVQFERGEEVAS